MGDSGTQKKKLNKNKLKKTIKNVLCRPDPIIWPEVSEDQKNIIETELGKHKVELPVFKKLHWKELKLIPKEKRPKPQKLEKVDGLFFGIRECCSAIENCQCSAVIIEATVNPRVIVQQVTEACKKSEIPFVCCQHLSKTTEHNFGIRTSCLGIKVNSLPDLTKTVFDISNNYEVFPDMSRKNLVEEVMDVDISEEVTLSNLKQDSSMSDSTTKYPYLYRPNRKARVFIPNGADLPAKISKDFVGQNYIEFSNKSTKEHVKKNTFKNMMVKRISNNPNRVKNRGKLN